MTTTLRRWLTKAGFDWPTGKIVYQEARWCDSEWYDKVVSARVVKEDDPVLDLQFRPYLLGGKDCPRFIARDKGYLYFPGLSVGAVWVRRIALNIEYYLDVKHRTPHPGEE